MVTEGFDFGSVKTDDRTGFVAVMLANAALATATYDALENAAGADYQVTAGKTFLVSRYKVYSDAHLGLILYYADDNAGTNAVPLFPYGTFAFTVNAEEHISYATVPAGKYFNVYHAAGANRFVYVRIEGVEV